ncbi:MAG: hypothetical protein M3345_01715 [Actinomycetota bacterium]|nr:hypothetical protein [Actinomycetota bacterium]
MSGSRLRLWIPWLVFAVSLLCLLAGYWFSYRTMRPSERFSLSAFEDLLWGMSFMSFPFVGAVIASGRSRNPIGWLMLAVGACLGPGVMVTDYVKYLGSTGGDLGPSALFWSWVASWYVEAAFVPIVLLFLLFPTGKLPSSRWRLPVRAAVVAYLIAMIADALTPGVLEGHRTLRNPYGLEGWGGVLASVAQGLFAAFGIFAIAAALSPFLRLRSARGIERQQLKWFAYAAALVPVVFLVLMIGDSLGAVGDFVAGIAFVGTVVAIAGSIGIAVLKYRLYDVDVLINRTLVYGALTAILAATYVGLVTAASTFAGDSPVAVAAATLAVAALFQPLRRRVQDFIDHRFYRRKYDAEKTVESFSARLRDEIDLDTLRDELLHVVDQTVQPARVSLWLRPTEGRLR